jgi:hypothetical protein
MRPLHLIPILLLTGCASPQMLPDLPPIRSVPGTTLPSDTIESVRYAESIKAYSLGRYIDPGSRHLMHEAHSVYRVETPAKWNLHPNLSQTISVPSIPRGPVLQLIDPARRNAPVNAEIIAEVNKQKAATQALLDQGTRLNQTRTQLSDAMRNSKQIGEQNVRLKQELDAARQRLDALEAELRRKQQKGPPPSSSTNEDW